MSLPFALSPSNFISNVGSDAGFAALIGLAILVLLYFAHAREAKTQREELEAARERIDVLERQLAAGTVSAPIPVAPRPAVATAAGVTRPPVTGTQAPPVPATASAPLAAPAGMAAPALLDATRVVPAFEELAEPDEVDAREQAVPAPALTAAGGAGTVAPPPRPLPAPSGIGTVTPPPPTQPVSPRGIRPAVGRTPSPVTAAAGGNGSGPAAGGQALRPGSLLREGLPGQRRRRSMRLVWPVSLILALIVAAVVLVVILTGGNSNSPAHTAAVHHNANSQLAIALKRVAPSSVTVAVLNGTTVNELAHRTGQRLTAKGFKEGLLATASNQSLRTTTIGYLPGHRLDALVVAHALKLTAAAVAPAQAASKALACPGSTPCSANVIVTVGTDLAHAP